jgi:riboflavin kinase/FMN adenylyltransferase
MTMHAVSRSACLTIGMFDGVHLGHQRVIRTMLDRAKADALVPICLTFDPDPEAVLNPDRPPLALSSLSERVAGIHALGVERVDVLEFSEQVARQSAAEFIGELRSRYDLRVLCVGEDFALGRDRAGTVDVLRTLGEELGFAVVAVPLLRHKGRPTSSTWVRELLATGDVGAAAELLGRPYCLEGEVVSGMQRGRQIGFPTANLVPPPGQALPADGVYFVAVERPDLQDAEKAWAAWNGVVNLGSRPTFNEAERLIETHVLDFEGDLYGERLRVCFVDQLRGIRQFAGIDELRAQIARDVDRARELARLSRASETGGSA